MSWKFVTMKYCSCKEIDHLVKALVRQGCSFQRGGKHGKLLIPSGRLTLTVPSSPSDRRAFLNFRRDIRHAMAADRQSSVGP